MAEDVVVYDTIPLQALRQFSFVPSKDYPECPELRPKPLSVSQGAVRFLETIHVARRHAGLDATDSESRNRSKEHPVWAAWGTLSFCVRPNVVLSIVLSYGWTLKKEGRVVDTGEWALTLRDPESFVSALVAWCES